MKIFIDGASLKEIKDLVEYGFIEGATTNPSLLSKEGGDWKDVLYQICEMVKGPVSAQVVSKDKEGMVKEGRELVKIHPNIVVKVPVTKEGVKAIKILSEEGIRVNTTLIFSPSQALLAARAGASFVSIFIGRLDDISHNGMEVVEITREIFDIHGIDTEIIAASIRHPRHVVLAALAGADIVTIPPKVINMLFKHPLTDIGLEKFLNDWKKFTGRDTLF